MDFLSSEGHGDYLEMQAGPAPTQDHTFPMAARATHEWTETFSPLDVDAAAVNGPYVKWSVNALIEKSREIQRSHRFLHVLKTGTPTQ